MPDDEYPASAWPSQRANSVALGARKRGAGIELGPYVSQRRRPAWTVRDRDMRGRRSALRQHGSGVSRVWRARLLVPVGWGSRKQGGDLIQACGYDPGACAMPRIVCAKANAPSYTCALFDFVEDQAHGSPLGDIRIHRGDKQNLAGRRCRGSGQREAGASQPRGGKTSARQR